MLPLIINVLLVLSQAGPLLSPCLSIRDISILFGTCFVLRTTVNYCNSTYSFLQPRDSIMYFDMDLYQTDLTRPRRGTPSSIRGFQDFGASAFLYSTHVLERFLWNSKGNHLWREKAQKSDFRACQEKARMKKGDSRKIEKVLPCGLSGPMLRCGEGKIQCAAWEE